MSDGRYVLACPFWIDTEAYTDRDREMFVAGFEFSSIAKALQSDPSAFQMTIHRENESRTRMAAGVFKRSITIEPCPVGSDPKQTYSFVEVKAK